MDTVIRITKENFEDYQGLDVLSFLMNPRWGEVDILTTDGKCYHSDYKVEGFPLPAVLPVLNEIEDDPAQNPAAVPEGWFFRPCVFGHYLFYKDSIKEQLEDNYLDILPDGVLEFDWESIVKAAKGDKSARIEVMESQFESVKEIVDTLNEALYQFRNDRDNRAILKTYFESGQWEEDNNAKKCGELSPNIARKVLKKKGLKALFEEIERLEADLCGFSA